DEVSLRVPDTEWAVLTVLEVSYGSGEPERYLLPLAVVTGEAAVALERQRPEVVLADVDRRPTSGLPIDARAPPQTMRVLYQFIAGRRRARAASGTDVRSITTNAMRLPDATPRPDGGETLEVVLGKAEQSNTSAIVGNQLILKLYRRVHIGRNP